MRKKKVVETQINERYRLSSDSLNIILQEKNINKKTRSEYWVNIAYFSSFENALDDIIERELKEAWVKELKYVVEKIAELQNMIRELRGQPLPELV